MKSIDKLREWVPPTGSWTVKGKPQIRQIADEIEAEIAKHYMELPVDADGVPIRVGDICEWNGDQFEVRQLRTDGDYWWAIDRLGEFCMAKDCHHVKPRTLEDVLVDMLEAAVGYSDAHTDVSLVAVEKYADEIRELLRGDV